MRIALLLLIFFAAAAAAMQASGVFCDTQSREPAHELVDPKRTRARLTSKRSTAVEVGDRDYRTEVAQHESESSGSGEAEPLAESPTDDSRLSEDGLLSSVHAILQRDAPDVRLPDALDPEEIKHLRELYRSYLVYRDPLRSELRKLFRPEAERRFSEGRFKTYGSTSDIPPKGRREHLRYRHATSTDEVQVVRISCTEVPGVCSIYDEIDALDSALAGQVVGYFRRRDG